MSLLPLVQALFSLGNLAYALREINQSLLLEVPTLLRVCVKIQQILDDSNGKVCSNRQKVKLGLGTWAYTGLRFLRSRGMLFDPLAIG